MTISIIVPVYNCQNYLRTCLDSLVNQTYKDLEIILVDDGSTDQSAKICDEYAKMDSRIRVLHRQNGGVSAARNDGIHMATKEYVIFVDADDWLELDACERIISKIHSDVSVYFWAAYYGDKQIMNIVKRISIEQIAADIIACNGKNQSAYIRASWAKVYKREILGSVIFPEEFFIGEDACFLLSCLEQLQNAAQIMYINEAWYHYRIVAKSAVRKYKSNLFFQSVAQYRTICSSVKQLKLENSRYIITAKALFCWQIFISLKKNEMKSLLKTTESDCSNWAKLTYSNLRKGEKAVFKSSKLQFVCWLCYVLIGEKASEKIIELQEKIKNYKIIGLVRFRYRG